MFHFDADISLKAEGSPGARSRIRRAWNFDLWAGPVPLGKVASAAGAFAAAFLGW